MFSTIFLLILHGFRAYLNVGVLVVGCACYLIQHNGGYYEEPTENNSTNSLNYQRTHLCQLYMLEYYCLLTSYKNYIICSFIDCRSGKCVKTIIPESGLKEKEALSWVGCIALDTSESWLVSFFFSQ